MSAPDPAAPCRPRAHASRDGGSSAVVNQAQFPACAKAEDPFTELPQHQGGRHQAGGSRATRLVIAVQDVQSRGRQECFRRQPGKLAAFHVNHRLSGVPYATFIQ